MNKGILELLIIAILITFSIIFLLFIPIYEYDNKPCEELGMNLGVKINNHTYCLPKFIRITE